MSTESWLVGPQSTNFYTRHYRAASPKAAIVFVHGFAEHCSRYIEIHTQLADNGVSVFTYDQRGYGNTALDVAERSKGSAYGKTNWEHQMEDLNWAVEFAKKEYPGLPVYIMGQSMGGGEVLGFATEKKYESTAASLAGVIATSPMVQQTIPVSGFLRKALGALRMVFPFMLFPADLKPAELSRDASVGEKHFDDPLVKNSGSLQALYDMFNHASPRLLLWELSTENMQGDDLRDFRWKSWPKKVPVIFFHGTGDRITSPTASNGFFEKLPAENKKYTSFDGAFHELSNELPEVKEQLLNDVLAFVDSTLIPAPETARL
ncbi:Alpha/Beta hydrolase protein [Mucidula mucida]|nr:Alpha/Beta hydrolase protein [Mucidula mucida]